MNYRVAEPTPPPKSLMKKKLVLSLMAMLFLLFTWQFGVAPYVEEFDQYEWKEDTPIVGKVLDPGFHFVTKFPFVITVPTDHIGVLEDGGWYYDTYYFESVEIPQKHIGIIYDTNKGVNTEQLPPGRYRINLRDYEVTIHPAEK